MQFDSMFEEALINKEWLIGVFSLFHITIHFQVKTSAYIFKDDICMNSLLVCSNIFSQSSSFFFSFLSGYFKSLLDIYKHIITLIF